MAQGLERIPLAVDSDFKAQPVRANFPDAPAQDFKLVAFEPDQMQAQPAPASLGVGDTLSSLGRNVWDAVVYHTPAAVAAAVEGDDPYATWDWKDALIGRARQRAQEVSKPGDANTKTAIPGITAQDINSLGPSAGFSAAGAAAGLGAGIPAGMVASPVAGYAAGMAASGTAAYRMATNQFVRDLHDTVNAESLKTTGKPASPQEFQAKQAQLADTIKAYGLWEAVPEAAGNALSFGILTAPVKGAIGKLFGKNIATRFAGKLGALYGEELATETVTQMGQHNAEVDAGMVKAPKREFTSPQDWNESLKEVAGPTMLQTTLMAGGFKAGQMAKDRLMGNAEVDQPDNAIPADDIGAGPGSGGPGAIDGEFIPAEPMDPRRGMSYAPQQGATYDQNQPTLPPGQPLLAGPQPMEGDVLGPESLPAGQALLDKPAIEGSATVQGGEFARPMLPAPEDGGPSERQVSTAIGLLKHSPKASPELLQRLMRVDQTMATMLFNHWKANGQVTGNQATEIPAPGDQGQGADIAGSRVVGGFSDGAVSFTPGAAAEGTAPGGKSGMALGAAGPDAVALSAARPWDQANRTRRGDEWFEGARVNESSRAGFADALSNGGANLQAHGMGKERTLGGGIQNLLNMLSNGLDANRGGGLLQTAPLVSRPGEGLVGATASGSAYSDGPFMLVARPGESLTGNLSGLGAVLINQAHADIAPQIAAAIRAIRPDIIVAPYSEAGSVAKQLSSEKVSAGGTAIVTPIDVQAHGAATSPFNARPQPTSANQIPANLFSPTNQPTNQGEANGLQNQGQEAAQEVSSKFDPQGLQPGTPEYEAAFDSWAAGQQESKRSASLEQRRVDGQAAVDKKNGWRKRLVSWFETAKDGDTITTDIEGEEYLVVEKTIKRNGKEIVSKRLVLVGNDVSNDQTIIEYRDGKAYTGPNTSQGIDEFAGWAQAPETDIDSRAASLGKLLEEGIAKVGAGGTALDAAAHQAATSPLNDLPQPTEAQKQAGNYAKGHVRFQGMDISIENPAGSVRSGKDEDGKAWENTLQHHYGYIKGTIGRDKDHLDVFIKPGAQSARTAYVVDQINPKTGKFDEHKIVLGADSEADARAIYQANYAEGWQGMGAITAMPIEQFKDWIKSGKTKKPLAYVEPKGAAHAAKPKAEPPPAAAIDPAAPYGKVGVAPFSSQIVGLKDNVDGTATVMRGDEPFYDFENGDPVTVPTGATAGQIRQAVTDAGALSSRDKWFGVAKAETKPAETGTTPAGSGTEQAKPEAIAGKPVADMPVEQLQKIASGESKTFGSAAVEKASAELARRDEADSPKATKEPWQYGELEYGDKYIDEVVLPDLRKQLANAHGGKFQEYPSKAAAVRGLKERIDTLENHRDAKVRKYYASLDNHYGAVRAALADGKPVPPVAYESYEDLKGDVSAGRINSDGQEVARVEQPQHIEAGQVEPATAPVIAASIKESAKNTPMDIEQARGWLLSEIDKAIIDAKSAKEEGIWNRADDKVNLEGIMDVGATIGFKTFNVPGDGKFRVLNLKESLQKFKKQVAASPGFKKNATRPMSLASGNGGKTSVRDLLDDGEYVLAADYGHLTGKPLLFGSVREGEAHPIAYTDAEPIDIKGINAQVGREWNATGKSLSWRVIETTTGLSVASESTKEKAISKALAHVDEHGTDKLKAIIAESQKVSQAELERQFTDWGSEEEAKAQKQRDAVERSDSEDRALWNSIWPLSDGEKRSPNPWNDIDHLQVVILAQDAAKVGKADEFVSLIERRRGGTNNVLALAARKALADAAPKAKPSKGAVTTGVASKILGDIYQRAAYNKWTWDRLKSYLTRELEEAGVGKSRMANALEKAMTEYARTANGRLGYPNSNLVFSAMRDYGLITEDAPDAQQKPGVDYKGFERTPTGNGNFTLKDGNLLVKVEAMGSGKFQASHGSAKSSPHITSEQGAVDWAANLRDASKKTTAYPFYSNNKLFNAEGTAELPKDWTGVARSDSGKRFFYLGQENGERSFNPLKAESYEDALKEAEGLKNDKPVVPDGYREVARGYFGGTIEKPIYAPFAEGERVRFIGGHAGNIQSFIGGPVTTGAIIKYDNGLTGRAEWRDVEAVKMPSAEQEPKNFKSIDTLNAANNPLGEDDWIRFADGSEWQVNGRMNGWALVQGKTEHPTVKNIMGQVPFIRAVVDANDAAQATKGAEDPSLPVNTGVNARMVVVEKGEGGVIAEPSSAAPGQFTSPKLGTKFANAREAVEWLAQNMDGEGFRHVAQKILPVVRSAPIHYVSVGDTVPAKVAELLSSGSAAVAYQAGDITDGKDAIYILEGKGDTEEGLLHEALHIATSRRLLDATAAAEFSDITKAIRSSLYDAGAKSTDQKFKQAIEFFRREFRSPGELVAYGFSSPAFQDLLKLMAADGKFYTDYRTPEQLAKVNKNASFQPQKRIPTPAYSMWHRFVDAVRALFGGPKAYQEAYERALAANAAIDRNNELASRVEFKTLEEKLHSLLDALLQRPELSLSKGGAAQPIRDGGLESRSSSTGFASTESTRAIQSIVNKFLKQFAGAAALDIRVVRTVADIPARFRPSPFAEGVFHDDAGLIYLVGMNLKHANGQVNTGRVWQVLMHEAVGHFGLAKMMGPRFNGILKQVQQAAKAKGDVAEDIYQPGHPDYATVEAVRLRYPEANDSEVAQEVLARIAETDPGRTLFGYVRAVVRQWLRDMARAAGITLDVTTAELNDLVAQASRYMRRGDGVAQGVDVDALGVADMAVGGMASKATGMESRAAPTAGQPQEPRTGILDTILRKAGGELAAKITGPAYDKLTAFLGGKVPEGIKAGTVSDYGLDESYVDRRTGMQTAQQKAARQTKTFVEGLMELDRAQSRVAYQWLNNRGAEADRLMAQLPPESQQVLKDIKIQIAKLTIEAVRLGQLDAETASRNFLAYLHRSYAKYDLNTDDKTWKAERAKAIKILGDQYKGRGLKMDVDPDRIHSAPGWWQDEMKGKRVQVLKNDAGRFAFVAEGTAIPPNLSGYKVEGVWEIRARKAADRITLWRDFTQDERQMMGELDEAKYAVARTLFMMNRDIEVGRFHEWVADEYAKTPEEAEEEGLQMADASDSMMRAFTPGEWVTVPTSKIPGTGVFKYGALAGMVVPGPVWNDIRQISAGRFEPFGAAYASILRAWKLSKTALTPTTHVNNIMGNFVMADMHDVGARDAIAAVRLMVAAANGDKDAKAMLDRFEDSGATQGMFTTHELKKEVLEPLLQQLREEVGMADDEAAILKASAIMSLALHGQFGEAWAGAKAAAKQSTAGRVTGAVVTKAQDYYQAEDSVFRLAAFLKSVDEGKTDLEAGKLARKAFLDYHINAPWINAMRGTAMPFIAFAYRAIPMLTETAAKKPWKIAKYMLVAGGLNALAYVMLGADADEDKERAYLPEEKAGRLWGIVPKLIRMPWNRESKLRDGKTTSDPVFLDVRRWIPVGDVVDYGQDKTALPMIPQPLIPGGPLIMAAEFLVNKSAFTGKELTKETDTWVEKAAKVGGHFYKGFMPNVPIPYSGTWAGTKIDNAVKGKEDPLGRAYPVPEAIASGFGLKLERYPVDTLQRNAVLDMKGKLRELSDAQRQAARDYGRQGMTKRELDEKVTEIVGKKNATIEEYKVKERKAMGR